MSQEGPGSPRRRQEAQGGHRRSLEAQGGPNAPGSPRQPRESHVAVTCPYEDIDKRVSSEQRTDFVDVLKPEKCIPIDDEEEDCRMLLWIGIRGNYIVVAELLYRNTIDTMAVGEGRSAAA